MNIEIKIQSTSGVWRSIKGTEASLEFSQIIYDPPVSNPIVAYTDFEIKFKSSSKPGKIYKIKYITDNGFYYTDPVIVREATKKNGIISIQFRGGGDFILPGFEKSKSK